MTGYFLLLLGLHVHVQQCTVLIKGARNLEEVRQRLVDGSRWRRCKERSSQPPLHPRQHVHLNTHTYVRQPSGMSYIDTTLKL